MESKAKHFLYHTSRSAELLAASFAIAIGSFIGSSFNVIEVSLHNINLPSISIREIDGRKLVHLTLWLLSIQTLLFIGTGTVFFLGYYRFESPARSEPDVAAGGSTASESGAVQSPSTSADTATKNKLWLYECHHNQENYLCFPPYCAPGGLRSRLFPSTTESSAHSEHKIEITASAPAPPASEETVEEETSGEGDLFTFHDPFNIPFPKSQTSLSPINSHKRSSQSKEEELDDSSSSRLSYSTARSTNPLDLILQSPYLPLPYFVRQALGKHE